jgi:hypothetical protein
LGLGPPQNQSRSFLQSSSQRRVHLGLDADHRRTCTGDSSRATCAYSVVEADGVGRGDGISEEKT